MLKVSSEVGKRLDCMLSSDDYSKESILQQHVSGWVSEKNKVLNTLSLSHMAQALFEGYEYDLTKGEKVLHYYNACLKIKGDSEYEKGRATGLAIGIKNTLQLLEIKIEGVE